MFIKTCNSNTIILKTTYTLVSIWLFSFCVLFFNIDLAHSAEVNSTEEYSSKTGFVAKNFVFCHPHDNLQKCIDKAVGKQLWLLPGTHKSYMVKIHSNTTMHIPKDTTIKLADDAKLPLKGGYVVAAHGTAKKHLQNIKIFLNGTIDGNKKMHPYEKSGNEGINFQYVDNSLITGEGTVINCSGDGIDIDTSYNNVFNGISLRNNSGSGFHFGSPRPITGSKNNIVINIFADNNGFKLKRNGIDLSWPNANGAIFINCFASNNYRNYQITAESKIINSFSQHKRDDFMPDEFGGSSFTYINGKLITNKDLISKKTNILIKNQYMKLFGKGNPDYNGIPLGDN